MATHKYRVHGAATVSRPVKVMYQDDEVDAQIDGIDVVLVPLDDPAQGTVSWQFLGKDAEAKRAEFRNNMTGTLTWEPDAPVAAAHAAPTKAAE